MDLRSPLGKVRGLGTAKNGSHHWWMQRLTAVALIPLTIWFVVTVLCAVVHDNNIVVYFAKPHNAIAMILFLGVAMYHGSLGIRVIIEDYVHCIGWKIILTTLLNFIAIITSVASILSVVYVHVGTNSSHNEQFNARYEKNMDKKAHKQWKKKFYNRLKKEKAEQGIK